MCSDLSWLTVGATGFYPERCNLLFCRGINGYKMVDKTLSVRIAGNPRGSGGPGGPGGFGGGPGGPGGPPTMRPAYGAPRPPPGTGGPPGSQPAPGGPPPGGPPLPGQYGGPPPSGPPPGTPYGAPRPPPVWFVDMTLHSSLSLCLLRDKLCLRTDSVCG